MNKIKSLSLIILLIVGYNPIAISEDVFSNDKITRFIEKSDLVVHFKLNSKATAKETMLKKFTYLEDGELINKNQMSTGIYTTYSIEVLNVLSGTLKEKKIDVKMSGGCYENECISTSIGFDYFIDQEGVLFLKYDEVSGNYFSYEATFSAYKVGKNNALYTGNNELNIGDDSFVKEKLSIEELLTLDSLVKKIKKLIILCYYN